MMSDQNLSTSQRWIWFLGIVVFCVAVDQASKVYAVQNWKGQPPVSYLNDFFRVEYAENHGAFLSLLSNFPKAVQFWVLQVANGVVLLGLGTWLLRAKEMHWIPFLPLTMVVGGGIGNLIDRVRFGYVIDYFNIGIGELRTGIFNVADMAITAGFFLMLPLIIWGDAPKSGASQGAPAEASGVQNPAS